MSLHGCITALATPFAQTGELDLDAWRRLLEQQLDGGVQGVVVAGSTGEAAALTDDEYATIIRIAAEEIRGRMPVIAGSGQMNTARTIAQTRLAAEAGAQYALVVTPAYVRPTQAGLVAHFRAVAEQGGLPVILYNVPGRTGTDMQADTVAQLAPHPGIVGVKEAKADPQRIADLLKLQSKDFAIFSGDDGSAARSMLAGADGLISVGSNALPAAFRHLCDLARGGDRVAAEAWDARMAELYTFLNVEPNPIPVKALLKRLGFGHGLRLPLLELSAAHAVDADRFTALAHTLETQAGTALAA